MEEFKETAPAAADNKKIALLPGSRTTEIKELFPLLSEVYGRLAGTGWRPVFSVAPGLNPNARKLLLGMLECKNHEYSEAPGRALMEESAAVAGSSGTATAEALLLQRYMVVLYRVRPLSALIGKMVLKNKFFAIPNLLAEREFFPEHVQDSATADNAVSSLMSYLDMDSRERESINMHMNELVSKMGSRGVYSYWAESILSGP